MSRDIKIFTVGNVKYTPIGGFHKMDIPYLNANGIYVTKSIKEADIIVAQNRTHLKKYFIKYPNSKKFMIWTNEPRFDTHHKEIKKELFGFVDCHIMNIYNQNVFTSTLPMNLKFFKNKIATLPSDFQIENRKTIGLMSYYKGLNTEKILINGEDVDLIKKRTEIALYGHKNGFMDIYGKDWPNGISKEDSRDGDWVSRKKILLDAYYFNLSFENTTSQNYITEKIWDSIANYCLPIYYGNNGIYELFPENSFLDYHKIKSPDRLFDKIQSMSTKEYTERMNKCIETYQMFQEKNDTFFDDQRRIQLDAITEKIHYIMNS
ncbi:glycosyltransferase family 10 [uncultured Dokdonia sp.]|uniref:glycosyltransferase family 10 domain-containing protein n=1 Tax=uncultured Dokdonia sp. TaxID=575653 RepID=UPI0026140740|nr:glycosyltransferase family 10 [uncultured Dokdonia sp.]